jgi:hypothetical protein
MAIISVYKLPTAAEGVGLEEAKEMIASASNTECRNVLDVKYGALETLRLLLENDAEVSELRRLIKEERDTGANYILFSEHQSGAPIAGSSFKQIGI